MLYARRDVRACYRALARSHIKTGVYCTHSPPLYTLPTHPPRVNSHAWRFFAVGWGRVHMADKCNNSTSRPWFREKDAQWGSYKTLYYYYESHLGVYLFSVLRGYYSLASFVTSRLLKVSKNLAKIRIQCFEVEFFELWWNITFLHFPHFRSYRIVPLYKSKYKFYYKSGLSPCCEALKGQLFSFTVRGIWGKMWNLTGQRDTSHWTV